MKFLRLVKILGVTLLTLILLLVAAPLFISAETLKTQVAEQVKKATGRTLEIKGDASVRLFPNIEVAVKDVTLGNPPGFKSPHLIKAKMLATGASLQPLLAGNLNVTGITLEGADIQLEETAGGGKNWEFAKAPATQVPADSKAKTDGTALKSFAIGDIAIKDSAVTFARPSQTLKASKINLTVTGADARGALTVNGDLIYQEKPVKLLAKVKSVKDVLAKAASPAQLALTIPNGSIAFEGTVKQAKDITANGTLSLTLDQVSSTAQWLTGKPQRMLPEKVAVTSKIALEGQQVALTGSDIAVDIPGGAITFKGDAAYRGDVAAKGNLKVNLNDVAAVSTWATGKAEGKLPKQLMLSGDVDASGKRYAIKNATLAVDDVKATGDIAANLQEAIPAITGTLKFGMLDLNTLMQKAEVKTRSGWMDAYAAPIKDWSDAPIDLSALGKVNAKLTLTADALRQGNLEISNLTLRPELAAGNFVLTVDAATLYSGNAKGTISANANDGQSVGANLTFSGIQLEPFLTALNGSSNLRGTTNLTLNVKARGASERAMVSSLNGVGDLKVTDGALKGINLAQFWRELKKGFLFDSPSKSTDFSELAGSFTIVNGVVSNQDLAMKSPALRLSGSGTVDLPRRQVNYRLVPSVVASVKGQGGENAKGVDIPVNITGSMDNPSITPDLAGVVQQQLKDPTALKQNIKDIKQTIKQFNSPEDIGKALLGGDDKPAAAPTAAPAAAPANQPAPKATPEQQLIQGIGGALKGL